MNNTKLSYIPYCEKICNCIGVDETKHNEIYVSNTYELPGTGSTRGVSLIMLNYCYFSKELAHIKNVVIDVSEPEQPFIFVNAFPYIKECFYKPYEPCETDDIYKRHPSKFFSNVSFGSVSEFIFSKCDNLLRASYHTALDKWFFSTGKKIDDTELAEKIHLNVNNLNKKYIYTFNVTSNFDIQLISVHVHSGIYTRKLPLHFFKVKTNNSAGRDLVTSPDELIENIKKFGSVIYFNPKIKCYIKLMCNETEILSEQFLYLLSRHSSKSEALQSFQVNKKLEMYISWLPDYILGCYYRKAIDKNIKFNIEEFYILRKIYGEKQILLKIEAELKKSTPKQLNNLINSMLEYYETCIS